MEWYDILTGIGFDVLKGLVGVLLTWVLLKLKTKYGLEISDERKRAIEKAIVDAILWAEEKYGPGQGKLKLRSATGKVADLIPALSKREIEEGIYSKLPMLNLGAAVKKTASSSGQDAADSEQPSPGK